MSKESAFEVGRLYVPIKQIADTLVASQKDVFVRLPGLMAYYPCGIRRGGGLLTDHSGNGLDGTQVGSCPTGYDGNAFIHLGDGVNYFHNSSTSFNLTGTTSYIDASIGGLTLGGWFYPDAVPVSAVGLVSKTAPSPQRGYSISLDTTPVASAHMSGNGAAVLTASSGVVSVGSWHFIVIRFIPSTELAVFLDGVKVVNTTAIPSSIFVSSQDFEVGRFLNDDARAFHGRARDIFVCASALSDQLIEQVRATSVP